MKYPRQVLYCHDCKTTLIPINSILPEHNGRIVLPGFEELCCLFANDIPYNTAQRLLGFYCEDEKIISDHGIENIVIERGESIRDYLDNELKNDIDIQNKFKPRDNLRREQWPEELQENVLEVVSNGNTEEVPAGLSKADWERIKYQIDEKMSASINLKSDEQIIYELSHLGPKPQPGELLIFVDEILVNNWNEPKYLQHNTAALLTTEGIRYLSGENIVQEIQMWVDIIQPESITVIADGAKWITKQIYNGILSDYDNKDLVLDWYHLRKKCRELLSMVCFGKSHKNEVLTQLMPLLWNGEIQEALNLLDTLKDNCRNEKKLSELINYITTRKDTIPNYSDRRKKCLYNGSAIVEKANDLLVARRQKHTSMQWTRKGGDALLALKTIQLNNEWDNYWLHNNVA